MASSCPFVTYKDVSGQYHDFEFLLRNRELLFRRVE